MKPSNQFTTSSIAVLLVGEPKAGKSSVMMAFPSLGIIDWDLNLASAIRRTPGTAFSYCQPAVDDKGGKRPEKDQWSYAVKESLALCSDPAIKTIAIDGLGNMCTALCDHIVAETHASGSNKTGRMELQNYGDLSRLLRSYIMTLRASGKYVVVTSHQTADKDDLTGAMRYFLAIPGQSKDTLGGCFTDVWAVTKRPVGLDGEKYEIRTRADSRHIALGSSFEFPSKGSLDITDKSPTVIWNLLEPQILRK
jgi:hypothetical protein